MKFKKARLMDELEKEGCVIEQKNAPVGSGQILEILIPGLDRVCILPGFSTAAALQRLFWNQLELRLDSGSGKFSWSWKYWTLGSVFQHALISSIVLICLMGRVKYQECLAVFTIANLVPVIASFLEIRGVVQKIRQRIRRLGSSPDPLTSSVSG